MGYDREGNKKGWHVDTEVLDVPVLCPSFHGLQRLHVSVLFGRKLRGREDDTPRAL